MYRGEDRCGSACPRRRERPMTASVPHPNSSPRRRARRLLALACLLVVALPASACGAPRKEPLLFGFNDNAATMSLAEPELDAAMNAAAGANVTRWSVDWHWIEVRRGTYNFLRYDQMYRATLARGIRPILILQFAPYWAWEPKVRCNQFRQPCYYPPGRAHDADWRRFVAAVATRYPEAAAIEVWNEPNLHEFWHSGPDARRYTELLVQAYRVVKRVAPRVPVVSGGLSNIERTDGGSTAMAEFLRDIYRNDGGRSFDVLGIHAYPLGTDFSAAGYMGRAIRVAKQLRARYDRNPGKPIWITETGLSRGRQILSAPIDERGQARGLVRLLRVLSATPGIRAVILHTLIDPREQFGIIEPSHRPRLAFCALARERGSSYRCPRRVTARGSRRAPGQRRDAARRQAR